MRKYLAVLSFIFVLPLVAFELDVNMGLGSYYTGANGKLVYKKEFWRDSSADIKHDSSATFYTWMEFSSHQKYWPKLRIEVASLKSEGSSYIHINSTDTINELIGAIEDNLPLQINDTYYDSHLVQNTYEGYLFYEYFEKSKAPSLGIGLGLKKFDFAYSATIIDGLEFTDNGGDTIPMVYMKSRYELNKEKDGAQLSFEVDGKVYLFGDSTIYDYLVKLDFMMNYNATTDLGIEFGYKNTFYDIKGGDINTVGGNMETSGLMFGLVAHFR